MFLNVVFQDQKRVNKLQIRFWPELVPRNKAMSRLILTGWCYRMDIKPV